MAARAPGAAMASTRSRWATSSIMIAMRRAASSSGPSAASAAREARDRWRVETHTRDDGTLVVGLRRGGDSAERVVKELPPGMDPLELASELQLAREDAELAVRELNRSG